MNPEEKEFQVDLRAFSNHSLEKLEVELDKCELLCSNCHREYHNPILAMDNIPKLIKNAENKKSFSNQKEYGKVCPVCGKKFLFPSRNLSTHPNPCCSRHCGGIKSHWPN